MDFHVLCGNCHTSFAFEVPVPPADAPPPLPSDRTQLSVTCTHCHTPMSLRVRTIDLVPTTTYRSAHGRVAPGGGPSP